MTLHEAIELVLIEFGSPMTPREIVEIINERGLYKKGNGTPVSSGQVSARINNYPDLFDKIGSDIVLRNRSSASLNNLLYRIADTLRAKSINNPHLVLAFLLFYFRMSRFAIGQNYFGDNSFEKKDYFRADANEILYLKIEDAVEKLASHSTFRGYSEELIQTFRNLNKNTLLQIISDLQLFDFSINSISIDQFGKAFNSFLNSFTGWSRDNNEFSTPELVSRYLAGIVKFQSGQTLCDPFAGSAGLASEILKNNDGRDCILQDINSVSVVLGKMNLILHGVDRAEYYQGDVTDFYRTKLEGRQFDYVVTNPPFGQRYNADDLAFTVPMMFLPSGTRGENFQIQLALHLLKFQGKAFVLIPDGFLFANDNASKELRRHLVLNDWIEAVHSLPFGSFKPFASINTSILILNKHKPIEKKGKIEFKEVSDEEFNYEEPTNIPAGVEEPAVEYKGHFKASKSVVVDTNEIEKNTLFLNVNRYLNELTLGPEYQTIESVLKSYQAGSVYAKKHLSSTQGIPFITIKDLAGSNFDLTLRANEITTFVGKMSLVKREALAWDGAVLVAKVGNKLKPTIFAADSRISSAAFSSNIIALYTEPSIISKEYLAIQLRESYFEQQLNQIRAGSAQLFMQLKEFLQLKILVPPLAEQEKVLLELYRTRELDQKPSKVARELIESTSQTALFSAIKHEFSNLKVVLDSDLSSLRLFIDKKSKEAAPVSWDDKIANLPDANTIQQVIAKQENILREMGSLFSDIESVMSLNKSNLRKEETEFLSFLEEQIDQMSPLIKDTHISYQWVESDTKGFPVMMDKSLLAKVIANFLVNSNKHGFEGEVIDKKIIFFDIKKSEDELWLEITMMNNGKKFEEGYAFSDFIAFGSKTGPGKGSGIGGYLMNKIIQLHDGAFEFNEYLVGRLYSGFSSKNGVDRFIPGVAFTIRLPYNY